MQAPIPTLCISAKKTHNKGSRTQPIMSTLMPRSGIPVICSRATLSCDSSYFFGGWGGGGGGGGGALGALGGNSDFPGLHLHNGAKRQFPEDGVWRVVTVYYFRHCAILFLFQDMISAVHHGL